MGGRNRLRRGRLWLTILVAMTLIRPATAREEVRLQLQGTPRFQFAGYYAALAQGYYRDSGLEVKIREASAGQDVVKSLMAWATAICCSTVPGATLWCYWPPSSSIPP